MRREVGAASSGSRAVSALQARGLEQIMKNQIDLTDWNEAVAAGEYCICSHPAAGHHHGKSCTHCDPQTFKYCICKQFKKENGMPKEKKARKKSEGRKPRLAGLVDSPLTIFMSTGGKEYKGVVLSSGVIKIDEKEFTSPSSAGSYILGNDKKGKPRQVDGWKSWTFNKDGERVPLDTLRGSKSPLKAVEANPKKARKPKAVTPKPKRTRKSRTPKLPVAAPAAQEATA